MGDCVCTGIGPNKKLAKRVAAEQMLLMLGYNLHPPTLPAKPALKPSVEAAGTSVAASSAVNMSAAAGDKHVTFAERDANSSMQCVRHV